MYKLVKDAWYLMDGISKNRHQIETIVDNYSSFDEAYEDLCKYHEMNFSGDWTTCLTNDAFIAIRCSGNKVAISINYRIERV